MVLPRRQSLARPSPLLGWRKRRARRSRSPFLPPVSPVLSLGTVICNCCGDCCINWTSLKHGSNKFAAPSRFRAAVEVDECNSCELCLDRCYFEAMSTDDDSGVVVIDQENCMGCGLCQVVCPTDAIHMELVRSEDFVPA